MGLCATVVLVTYAERWTLLREVLDELLHRQAGVAAVVVVDNGSTYDLQDRLIAEGFDRVHVVKMESNLGSAKGFAVGIETAISHTSSTHIWLLDDDNKPAPNCLERLLCAYHALGDDPETVLLAHRKTRHEQVAALWRSRPIGARPNAFLGFHIMDLPGKLVRYTRGRGWNAQARRPTSISPMVSIAYGPYGGLLFHRSCIDRSGLPDARYFLYADDFDFTSRMVKAGAKLVLCGFCEVQDLEESWALKGSRAPALVAKASSEMRTFYSVRNRVYWEWSTRVSARSVYFGNGILYVSGLLACGLIAERAPVALTRRVKLISRAVSDGVHGRLGKSF